MSIASIYSWADEANVPSVAQDRPQILTPKIYTIYNISMDETSSSANMASHNALRKAERVALEKLFRKIIREEDQAKLPIFTDGQVTELVSGIEVANEKISNVRYLADFTVHFNREKIYNLLSVMEIPFAETLSNPVIILTVLEKEGATLLWEENNEWRRAWQNYTTVNNLVPIQIMEPSLANRMAIPAWQVQSGHKKFLQTISEQKGIRKLYVMSGRLVNDIVTGKHLFELTITSNREDQADFKSVITAESKNYDPEILYNEAIKQATYWLDNQWKEKVMIHFGVSSHLKVKIEYSRSMDWFDIKKRLEGISLIRKIIPKSFTVNSAIVEIEHSGDMEQIILTLNQEKMSLEEQMDPMKSPDEHLWILRLKN